MYMYKYIGYSAKKLCNTAEYFYDPVYVFKLLGKKKLKLTSKNAQPYYTTFHWINCLLYDS